MPNRDEYGGSQNDYGYAGADNPRDAYGGEGGGRNIRSRFDRILRQPQAPGFFAPFGGDFPFLNNIPSGQLSQSFMPPIAPPAMGAPPMNLEQLYGAYNTGPGGVMPGFLPPQPAQPPVAGIPPWLQAKIPF